MIKQKIGKLIDIDWKKLEPLQPNDVKINENKEALKKSLLQNGFVLPFAVWIDNGIYYCIDGHTRKQVLLDLTSEGVEVPKKLKAFEIQAKNRKEAIKILVEVYNQKHNPFNQEILIEWLEVENVEVEELESVNVEEAENETHTESDKQVDAPKKLTDKFIVPPFSVLDTRQGYWQDRKRYWQELIKDRGESREGALKQIPGSLMGYLANKGVSVLDPVLSEILNRWFGLENCKTFDCFAGDSVFGYVSSYLGNSFTGIELRQEQTDLNNERIKGFNSIYYCDDGRNVLNHIEENSQDLLFSCPPYFNLEVYSDLPNDASNQREYESFIKILDTAFTNSIKCLKDNRFAVIVVGDIRDKKGFYYGFVDDIKDIFKRNGMLLYNELIMVEALGTLPQRVGRYMDSRKIGKCHQNILVFLKGDSSEIKKTFPKLKINYES